MSAKGKRKSINRTREMLSVTVDPATTERLKRLSVDCHMSQGRIVDLALAMWERGAREIVYCRVHGCYLEAKAEHDGACVVHAGHIDG